jgi:hypothetical protein
LEQQVDEVEERVNDIEVVNGGSKRKDEEYSDTDTEELEPEATDQVQPEFLQTDQNKSVEHPQSESIDKLDILHTEQEKGKKSKRTRRRKSLKKVRELMSKIGRMNESPIPQGDFWNNIDERLRDLEAKVKGKCYVPRSPGESDPNRIVVSYDEFSERK